MTVGVVNMEQGFAVPWLEFSVLILLRPEFWATQAARRLGSLWERRERRTCSEVRSGDWRDIRGVKMNLTSLTSHVDDTTAKPDGCAAAMACGDAIMMLVCDMLGTQWPPSSWTASLRSVW